MTGKPDLGDRLAQFLVAVAALFSLANGLFMLTDPLGWYQMVDTVKFTGPPNLHFMRDIGLAYGVSGVALGYAALNLRGRWGAALLGAFWLGAHGALHLYEVLVGICASNIFWSDVPGVMGPPLLALLGVAMMFGRAHIAPGALPKRIFVRAFDRMTQGTSPFIHDLAASPGFMTEKFQHFMPVSMHRHATPADLFHVARIGATLGEDCGPCVLITAKGALADGVSRALVNDALAARLPDGPLALAFSFGRAVATQDTAASALGDAIEADFGRTVRTELAVTAAMVRTYPALKRGLGIGKPCGLTPLQV